MYRHAMTARETDKLRRMRTTSRDRPQWDGLATTVPRDRDRNVIAEQHERGARDGAGCRRLTGEQCALLLPARISGSDPIVIALLGDRHRERARELDATNQRVEHGDGKPRDRDRDDETRER